LRIDLQDMIEIVHVEPRLAGTLAVAEQIGVLFPERNLPGGSVHLLRQSLPSCRVSLRFARFRSQC
jgi:hypothetical protein